MIGYGMTEDQILILKKILSRSFEDCSTYKIWVYGSRARGDHKPYSDLDLLIDSDPAMSGAHKAMLEEELENSAIPFKVDMTSIDRLFDPYRAQVDRDKIILMEKP